MLTTLLRQSAAGLRVLLVMTVLLGLGYPFAIYGVSRIPGLHAKAEGSLVVVDGQVVGSELIGIDPVVSVVRIRISTPGHRPLQMEYWARAIRRSPAGQTWQVTRPTCSMP